MCERETNSLYKSRKSSHHLTRGIRTQLTHWLPFPRGLFSKNLYLLFGKRPTLTQTHKHIYFIYIYETYLSHRPSKQEQQELLSTYGKSGWHQQPQAHSHITSHQVTQYKTQDPSKAAWLYYTMFGLWLCTRIAQPTTTYYTKQQQQEPPIKH